MESLQIPKYRILFTENEDFMGVNQTLTFTSNARVQEIQIVIFDDEIIEVFDEHFSIWIRSNGEVIDTAHVTIKENDGEFCYILVSWKPILE